MNIFKKISYKLFYYSNTWQVGYRLVDTDFDLPINKNISYQLIPLSDGKYYADPFVFKKGDDVYIFAEYMNRYYGKGTIAVSKFVNGKFTKFKEVLKEDCHLSFPNVFEHNGEIFMIPETSKKGQVRLYKARSFPNDWELQAILLDDGKPYVDTVFLNESKNEILCYYESDGKQINQCYSLDFSNLKLLPINKKCDVTMRPAGNAFECDGNVYRMVQNGKNYYGQSMFVVDTKEPEKIIGEFSDKCILAKPKIKISGTHTFNRTDGFEVIDIKYNRFCITKSLIRLYQLFKKIWR